MLKAPTLNKQIKKSKALNGHEIGIFLRIYTIFCMREAINISDGSPHTPKPPRPLKRTSICFLHFSKFTSGLTF